MHRQARKCSERLRNREAPIGERQMYRQEQSIVPILFSSTQKSLFPGNMFLYLPLHRGKLYKEGRKVCPGVLGGPQGGAIARPSWQGCSVHGICSLSCFLAITPTVLGISSDNILLYANELTDDRPPEVAADEIWSPERPGQG